MKVGDKVYCFKDYYVSNSIGWKILFCKGVWYCIDNIKYIDDYRKHYGICYKEDEENIPSYWIYIMNKGELRAFALIRNGDKNFFHDHFYTEAGLRKIKILKIEDSCL